MLDRLLHHAVVVVTEGESYRMREAKPRGDAARTRPKHAPTVDTFDGHQGAQRVGAARRRVGFVIQDFIQEIEQHELTPCAIGWTNEQQIISSGTLSAQAGRSGTDS
jgi:hypothetical protein